MIQEDVNQRTVSLSIRAGRLTASVLARALRDFLNAQKKPKNEFAHGKQTLKQLMKQNAGAVNIEVDEGNIKSFDRVARKYRIDYAVKKDKSVDPPKYFVFFKSRDQDAMTMAFQEFVKNNERKKARVPFKMTLQKFRELSQDKNRQREKTKTRDRGQSL